MSAMNENNYYDILQVSRHADPETIHRVFRIMAGRFHPDNPKTGSPERFHLLRRAYQVPSDPKRRAEYDALCGIEEPRPIPLFELKDFLIGVEGEQNRRLGVLSLLYNSRRRNTDHPGVSLLDLEKCMAIPREYLEFTLWFLKAKGYVVMQQNSDFALTAEGAEYVETHSSENNLIRALLAAPSLSDTVPAVEDPVSETAADRVC
jgi:hypothetical protein